jgi:hypothetical protein
MIFPHNLPELSTMFVAACPSDTLSVPRELVYARHPQDELEGSPFCHIQSSLNSPQLGSADSAKWKSPHESEHDSHTQIVTGRLGHRYTRVSRIALAPIDGPSNDESSSVSEY